MSTPTAPLPANEYPEPQWLQPVLLNAVSYLAFSADLAKKLEELEAKYPSRTGLADGSRASESGR